MATAAMSTDLVEIAAEVVTAAGRMLRATYFGRRDLQSRVKGLPHEIVTEADTAAHRMISDQLLVIRPADGLTSEEADERSGELTWIVDPLDGTANFVRGIPHWCVAAACVDVSGATIAAAVYDPNRGELFTAGPNGDAGPYGNGWTGRTALNGIVCTTSTVATVADALVLTGLGTGPDSASYQRQAIDPILAACRSAQYFCAPILDQAWVACGRADASIDYWLHEWDVIPGRALVHGAGGATAGCRWVGHDGGLITAATPQLLAELVALSGAATGDDATNCAATAAPGTRR